MEHGVTAISLTSCVTQALTPFLLCWGCSIDAHLQSNWHIIDIGVTSVLPPPWWMWAHRTHHHKTAHSRAPMPHDSVSGDLVSEGFRETLHGSWDNGANDLELTSSGRSNFSYPTDEAAASDRQLQETATRRKRFRLLRSSWRPLGLGKHCFDIFNKALCLWDHIRFLCGWEQDGPTSTHCSRMSLSPSLYWYCLLSSPKGSRW